MGESDSTVSQPPKPVCDWSLGRLGGEVKGDFPEFFSTVQTVPGKPFTRIPVFPQAVENRIESARKHAPKPGNCLKKLRERPVSLKWRVLWLSDPCTTHSSRRAPPLTPGDRSGPRPAIAQNANRKPSASTTQSHGEALSRPTNGESSSLHLLPMSRTACDTAA
jgi:hypothetical protein